MATHSSVLAWRMPGTGEPGRLLSMGSHSVGHDRSELAAFLLTFSFFIFLVCVFSFFTMIIQPRNIVY